MKNSMSFPIVMSMAALLSACASTPPAPIHARADLSAASGGTASGVVLFTETSAGLRADIRVSGLTPGEHGFHVHEVGDCSAPDASSAKGHYNPHGKAHGRITAEHHVGDMPNLPANAAGNAHYSTVLPDMRLHGDTGNVLGRAVVIHADPDDYRSQPAGNSGKRIACGVIRKN